VPKGAGLLNGYAAGGRLGDGRKAAHAFSGLEVTSPPGSFGTRSIAGLAPGGKAGREGAPANF